MLRNKGLLGLDMVLTIHHQVLLENAQCSPRLGGKWVAPEEWTSICPLRVTLSKRTEQMNETCSAPPNNSQNVLRRTSHSIKSSPS